MLFDNCPPDLKMYVLREATNGLFFRYAYLMEADEKTDFSEVVKIGNQKFKGRFQKLYNDYKTKKNNNSRR